ncbi:Transposon TX1 uncharacterized 149 kDa protein [Vitis vinifera]|uniref:Transposon TX1 uncharacterized 149 kDa protein n=1 Tax=Vitis vinifera TaxID=29760 RepID=A0A438DB29_VITVI|nr:Transposon TX1 uncharacterized 149 kDa protein [Vitis vinifera]
MGEGAFYGNETPISPPRARVMQSPSKIKGGSRDASREADPLVGLSRDSTMLCSSQLMDRGHLTNEALCEEASRYVDLCFIPLGGWDLSSSSPSSFERVTLNEGSFGVLASKGEKPVIREGAGGEFEGLLQDLDGCRWDDSCLVRFSKFLGFSTEGFQGEILTLLLRTKRRREQNLKKGSSGTTKFDRELKKVEWSINYNGVRKENSLAREGGETKIQEMSQGVIHSLGVGRFLGWGAVNARGAAGGVVVFWDKRVLELVGLEVGIFSISCRFKNCEDGFTWFFTGVYGPTLKSYREPFWEELGAIRGLWSDPWCIGGDFNVIRFPSERSREGRLSGTMRRFSEVLDELALRDLPLQGGPYTWSEGLNGQSRVRRGPIPFRFENMWLKEEGFKELLKGWWQVGVNLRMALDKVSFWDDQERHRALNEQELEARKEARAEFKKWAIMEEISWRQKSKETWLKEGDKNTEDQEIQRGVVRAYQDLLSDPGGWHPSMSSLEFDRIGSEEAARLEEMFSMEEVYLALSELNGDKAPGPDGFPIAFWQFCWDFVKDEIMGFFKDFFERGKFVRSLNSTFLVLVPKKGGADDLRDYRPISLVGGLYKILAKVLANRLKKVVSKVVSPTQNAFVEGRQILDVALIANEAIDSLLKGDEAGVLCKLDLEKAYDHINWDFLMTVMQKMGFGEKWTGWIRWCISTASFSVLINGSPAGFFQSTRGVENAEVLAFELGCKVGSLPSTYLGLPLGALHKLVAVWDGVEERMRKRLALWKRQFISKGGRITLIWSTLASMPIYLMSLMRMRVGALLCKWSWRFAAERESFWKLIISKKYGEEGGGWISCEVREGYGVGLWKEISKEGALMFKNVSFTVGDGRRVKFWKDIWCGNIPLCEAFPSLFAFAVSQDAWVADCWDSMGDAGGWYPCFSRPFNDWEMEVVASLLSFLQGKRLIVGMEDRVWWNASKNGIFSVKSLYNTLDSSGAVLFPWRIIWSPCVPTKVGFFCLGSFLGEDANPRSTQKEGLDFSKQVLLVL